MKDFIAGLINDDFKIVDAHIIEQSLYDKCSDHYEFDIVVECDKVEDEYILANVHFDWNFRTGEYDVTTFDVEAQLNGGYNEYKPNSAEDKALEAFIYKNIEQ